MRFMLFNCTFGILRYNFLQEALDILLVYESYIDDCDTRSWTLWSNCEVYPHSGNGSGNYEKS